MADTKTQTWMITDEDLNELQELKADLQSRVDSSRENGRVFMMNQYVTILAKVNVEVRKVRDRFDRESMADNRRTAKELKAGARGESGDE